MRFTGKDGTDLDHLQGLSVLIHTLLHDHLSPLRRNHMVCFYQDITVLIYDILAQVTSRDTLLKALYLLIAVHKRLHIHARDLLALLGAIHFVDDQFLRYVDQTSGQISGIGGTKSRIGQTLTRSVSGHEILQYVQAFTEIRLDRQLDGTSCRICHQPSHTCKLFDLFIRTTGSGIRHHEDIVVFIQSGQQRFCQRVVSRLPGLDNLFVTLFLRDQASFEVLRDLIHRILRLLDHLRLLRRHGHI